MKFLYQARDDQGRHQDGAVQAASQEAALQILDRHGLYVTVLREEKPQPLYAKRISLLDRVSGKEVMLFSRQLSIMFKARVSLVDALSTIGKQAKNRALREKLIDISEEVEAGVTLSDALAKHPKVFSSFYVNIIKRGEALGKLSDVLEYLADYLEREQALKSKIKGALIYPAFVVGVAFAVLTLLAIAVLPNLISVLEESESELPAITKAVIAASEWYQQWWWAFAALVAAFIMGIIAASKTKKGKSIVDRLYLRIPMLGKFLRMMYISRFGDNLSTLITGGVSIVEGLEITKKVMGNEVYEQIIVEAKDSVSAGNRLTDVFQKHPREFPEIFTQMMEVGEKTGSLDTTLVEVVGFYQKETEQSVDAFLAMLEPLLIVILGVLVGGLMISLMLPLYQSVSGV
jgi:type IV pilus assembly protein PilC